MKYRDLVSRVNTRFAKNSSDYHELFWMPSDLHMTEINLWTYWQGITAEHPRIMVVGQDWGAGPEGTRVQDNGGWKAIDEYIQDPVNSGEVFYFKYAGGDIDASDVNLTKYLNMLGPYDVMNKISSDLFFTNLIPGCRKGTKGTGGFKAGWVTDAVKQDFRDLVEIKKPQVILCMGKDTYVQTAKIFGFKSVLHGMRWNDYLDSDRAPLQISAGGQDSYIFALPHPGYFGELNRRKGQKRPVDDWQQVKDWLDQNPF